MGFTDWIVGGAVSRLEPMGTPIRGLFRRGFDFSLSDVLSLWVG